METLKGFFVDLQSKSLPLNYSGIKSIQVCLDPASLPDIKPVYKLNDNDHHCSITFSKETMKAITDKSGEISRSLGREEEKTFFVNDEMKVFSERMHNQCAVSILSIQGVRINMMDNTFSKMMNSSGKLDLMHSRLQQKVNSNAKNLKQLLDIILAKYNQCNANSPDFKVFLQQLHQSASSLCGQGGSSNTGTQNLNTSDTSNDNEDEDDDEDHDDENSDDDDYYGRRGRRGRYGYDYDDEEDDEFDDEDIDEF